MRPPTAISTDADMNLYDAIRVAACPDAAGKGALVVLNNEIQAARDVTKTKYFARRNIQVGRTGIPRLRRFGWQGGVSA
jgi:L-asparaginase/Glu-tRNA(Gln) amidotransferase subunit D